MKPALAFAAILVGSAVSARSEITASEIIPPVLAVNAGEGGATYKGADRAVLEHEIGKVIPRRVSEYIVSPDGRHVAYIAGSGRYFPGTGGPHAQESWQIKSLVVDGRVVDKSLNILETPVFSAANQVGSDDKAAGSSWLAEQGRKPPANANGYRPTFSPDRKHVAYLAGDSRQGQFVVLDGHEGNRYSTIIADNNLAFSPDSSRLAYRAGNQKGAEREYFVVVNGKEGKAYRGLENYLHFSPDSRHLLYLAQVAERTWTVVVDENEGRHYTTWAIRNPVFSPDSKHVAYVVATMPDGGERFAVVDGREGKHYSGRDVWMDHAFFSPDSTRVAYALRQDGRWVVVAGEVEGKRYAGVGEIAFSPKGLHLAYVASSGAKSFVVRDGLEGKQYDLVSNLVFSPDDQKLAYVAYSNENRQWCVVVNGQEGKKYDFIMAKNIYDQYVYRSTQLSSLHFDSANTLRYLAVKRNAILAVEEHFGPPGGGADPLGGKPAH